MIFLKLKYYFSKFKICIYICGVILVLFTFVTLLGQVNLFTRADSQTLLGIIGTLLGAVIGAVFSLLGSIWVNAQQRKEELNRKRAQEIYRPLYDELVNIHKNILKENSRSNELFKSNFLERESFALPYISKDKESFSGTLVRLPLREEIPIQIEDQLVVEYFSR